MKLARHWGLLVAAACLSAASSASAVEIWSVQSGRTTIHFNTEMMERLGLSLTGVNETVTASANDVLFEAPHWHFAIDERSTLRFEVENGIYRPGGMIDGAILHSGGFGIQDLETGATLSLQNFEIGFEEEQFEFGVRDVLHMQEEGETSSLELQYGKFRYIYGAETFQVFGFDIRVTQEWAEQVGRPRLAGHAIAMGEIVADIAMTGGTPGGSPQGIGSQAGDFKDVKLGILNNIEQKSHAGNYPNGVAGLSMATTSCNVGNVDVPWHAPMEEDHPGILMHLYRELDGRFEQVGISAVKHGFYALSNSQCTQCQNPSNGTFLGVGCSDTYGFNNNSDRNWLAPRDEWSAYNGTWECTASHFADYENNCGRNHGSGGHATNEHRLEVKDEDLGNEGATYWYEGLYLVRGDQNKINNAAHRECTIWYDGSNDWDFEDIVGDQYEGPALLKWGDLQVWQQVPSSALAGGTPDGEVLLATSVTDLGGGQYHYEYALYNYDSDREVRRFSVPIGGASVTNMGFHDPDLDSGNEWTVSISEGVLTWETDDNPLSYGKLYNFRFDANTDAEDGFVEAETYNGGNDSFDIRSSIPGLDPTDVGETAGTASLALRNSPNPLSGSTSIHFELSDASPVSLDIFDASGRRIHALVDGTLNAGSHDIAWDGKDENGETVSSGVYYYRLEADDRVDVRSMHVIR